MNARTPLRRRSKLGSIWIEFALVALVVGVPLAVGMRSGQHTATTAHVLQEAAQAGARELSLIAFPADAPLEKALADPRVRAMLYDPALLAIDVTEAEPLPDSWPLMNRLLYPLMVSERIVTAKGARDFLHYPGEVVRSEETGELTVAIPRFVTGADGVETLGWTAVVEAVWPAGGATTDGSSWTLRVNYPDEEGSAAISGIQAAPPSPAAPGSIGTGVSAAGDPVSDFRAIGLYSGPYGNGRYAALDRATPRPRTVFRRPISGEASVRVLRADRG